MDDLQSQKAAKHDGAQLYAKDKRRMVALTERQAERWKVGLCHLGWTGSLAAFERIHCIGPK